jgi:hypothetical protein
MSSINRWVVIVDRSLPGSVTNGRLRPHPRWSNE